MDIATLGIRVDAGGAVAELDRLGGSLTKTARHTDTLTGNARKQEENLRSLARQVAASGGEIDRYAARIIRLNGGLEAFKRIQGAVSGEMARGETRTLALATATDRLSGSKSNAALSATKLQGNLRSLATNIIGLNSQVAGLANVLGTFAVGSGVMVGILAGLAALGFIYNRLTSDTQAAKKASDDLVESLSKQRKASRDATEEGAKAIVVQAKASLLAAQQRQTRSLAIQSGSIGLAPAAVERLRVSPTKLAADVQAAADAIKQAEADVVAIQIRGIQGRLAAQIASHELAQGFAADEKRRVDELDAKRKKAHDAEVRRFNERLTLAKALADLASDPLAAASNKIGTRLDNFFNPAANPLNAAYQSATPPGLDEAFERAEKARQDKLKRPIEEAAKEVSKFSQGLKTAGQTISQAFEYFIVSKLGGGSAGGSLGGSVGKGAAGALGGFGGTALGQAIFAPLLAGLGAFLGDKLGGIFGKSSAQRQKEREQRRANEDLAATMEILRAKTQGLNVELLEQIEANRKFFSQLKQQIEAALPGTKNESNRNRQLAEAERMRQIEEDKIRRDYERSQREKREELEVRALRAQGKNKEAEALRKQLDDAREIAEAEKAGMDAAYIARLKEIQAIERGTKALDELTGSLRNAPAGFKVAPYSFEFGAPKTFDPKYPAGGSIPYSPTRPAFPKAGTSTGTVNNSYTFSFPGTDFILEGNTTEEVFKSFITKLRQKKDATLGATGTLSEALDRM